jgi:hypothetical protein
MSLTKFLFIIRQYFYAVYDLWNHSRKNFIYGIKILTIFRKAFEIRKFMFDF